MKKDDLIQLVNDTITLVDNVNYKQAEYSRNDEEIELRAKKLAELLNRNGKISDSQIDDIYEKLLNHKEALEMFYSNEKIGSYSVLSDNFGVHVSNKSSNGKLKPDKEKEIEASRAFISELFS